MGDPKFHEDSSGEQRAPLPSDPPLLGCRGTLQAIQGSRRSAEVSGRNQETATANGGLWEVAGFGD